MSVSMNMKKMVAVLFLSFFGMLGLSGCDSNDGPAESLGETVDEAVEDTKREVEDATD